MLNRWYRRLRPGSRLPAERPRTARPGDQPRRLPPMLGVFGVLALVLVATVVVALLFRDNWV
ncbi:MAG TPA: hypothetical protein VGR27_05340, partial [Longimicrobiaceae bacterium]|nr:hypothetical protein [Longimicrobiaceae bacterium]